jgi:hypothetical protein
MSNTFTLNDGYIAAEVRLHSVISGTGRAELPILLVPLDFTLRGPRQPGRCYDFRELRCRVSPFDSTYVADSRPANLDIRVPAGKELPSNLVHLEIPLDRTRLALLNRLRKGQDVTLRLDLELQIDELAEIKRVPGAFPSSIWGIAGRYRRQGSLTVTIPRSPWLDQILPGTEFAKSYLIELPAIPIDNCSDLKLSLDALQQAVKLEGMGFYNEAVAQCRTALEPFFEKGQAPDAAGGTQTKRVLKAAWQTRLGRRTYDWLSGSFLAVNQAANQPHHPSSSGFDQAEAQMLLIVTTALISYAIKTRPPAPAQAPP